MCGRVVIALDSQTLASISKSRKMRNEPKFRQSYNLPPGSYLPTVYKHSKSESSSELEKFLLEAIKWGTKNKDNISLINARYENLSLYYKSWKRCVVIIGGYYEWKQITSQSGDLKTQPYFFHNKDKNYLLLACLYKLANSNLEEEVFTIML
jgi:hypothetical protein